MPPSPASRGRQSLHGSLPLTHSDSCMHNTCSMIPFPHVSRSHVYPATPIERDSRLRARPPVASLSPPRSSPPKLHLPRLQRLPLPTPATGEQTAAQTPSPPRIPPAPTASGRWPPRRSETRPGHRRDRARTTPSSSGSRRTASSSPASTAAGRSCCSSPIAPPRERWRPSSTCPGRPSSNGPGASWSPAWRVSPTSTAAGRRGTLAAQLPAPRSAATRRPPPHGTTHSSSRSLAVHIGGSKNIHARGRPDPLQHKDKGATDA